MADTRLAFVHEAKLQLESGTDSGAVGAAVTTALCGHWEHEGPCRWPHNNAAHASGARTSFRTLFVAPAAEEDEVRQRIEDGLRRAEGWVVLESRKRPTWASRAATGKKARAVSPLPHEREHLEGAKARLDRLDLYDVPVSLERVRVLVEPRLFRVLGFRGYYGYAFWRTIVVRDEYGSSDLLTHELCHVWQAQRRPLAQLWAWVRHSYGSNPFEREARAAVAATR